MHTKTATAVVLALLGAAHATKVDPTKIKYKDAAGNEQTGLTLTKDNYATYVNIKNYKCTARDSMDLLSVGLEEFKELKSDADQTYLDDLRKSITKDGAAGCHLAVQGLAKALSIPGKHCVSHVAKSGPRAMDAASCSIHVGGWGVACDESAGASAVFLEAGEFDDAAPVWETNGPQKCGTLDEDGKYTKLATATARTQRWCRCPGFYWGPEMRQKEDANGKKLTEDKKDKDGNVVMKDGKAVQIPMMEETPVMDDSEPPKAMKTVNGEPMWNMNQLKCPARLAYKCVVTEGCTDLADGEDYPWMETNWQQLPKATDGGVAWMKSCPTTPWEVPADPMPLDMGSFKGYSNKFTFAPVNDNKYDETKAKMTFNNESDGYAGWSDAAKIGCIGGFAVFGLAIMIVACQLVVDMRMRMRMYKELIEDDLNKIKQMGLAGSLPEMETELAARLAGGKEEGGVDDQLVTQALELSPGDFAKHM